MIKIFLLLTICVSSVTAQVSQDWIKRYNGPGNNKNVGIKVLTDNAGNVYETSTNITNELTLKQNILTLKYDANGNQIWGKEYSFNNMSNDLPIDMKIDNDGNIIVIGETELGFDNYDIIILKYDSSGNEMWNRKYGNSQNTNDLPRSLFIDNSGNIFVTGYSFLNSTADIITLKYDPKGILLLNRSFNGSSNNHDLGYSVTADDSGNVYVAGSSYINNNYEDYVILKYGPGGNILWGRFYNGVNNGEDYAYSVKVDNSNNIIISGNTNAQSNSSDITTLKFSSTGNLLWERTYSRVTGSFDRFRDLKLDDSNNIYIHGLSYGLSNSYHTLVLKYDENGNKNFISEYLTDQSIQASAFELDISNNMYIATSNYSFKPDSLNNVYLLKFNQDGNLVYDSIILHTVRSLYRTNSMCLDISGKIYVSGSSIGFKEGTAEDATLMKFDTSGNSIWQQYYLGEGNYNDAPSAMITDSSGNIFVTGTGSYGTNSSFITIKYKPDGEVAWQKIFNRRPGKADGSLAIAKDNTGNIIVAGYTYNTGTNSDILIVKYDSSGAEQWYADFAGPGNGEDKPNKILTDNLGNIYITGSSVGTGSGADILTAKFSGNGNLLWTARYNGMANSSDIAYDIALDNANNIFVTGISTESSSGTDGVTIKYNPSGVQEWIKIYNGSGNSNDVLRRIKIDSQNKIYVSGETGTVASLSDFLTIKYDNAGNEIWTKTYNGPLNNSDRINDMIINNDNIYVTGESVGAGIAVVDYYTIKYDSSGNEIWNGRFNGSTNRNDKAFALTIDQNQNLYVTGQSVVSGSNTDIVTLKYKITGEQEWLVRYNGETNSGDNPVAIAVNRTGDVYVTGTSPGLLTGQDIITIKYSQTTGIQNVLSSVPLKFNLSQNYPNPFNPVTNLDFGISELGFVSLKVFDILGKEVATLVSAKLNPGLYKVNFDGSNLPSGVYIYKLETKGFTDTKKLMLIK